MSTKRRSICPPLASASLALALLAACATRSPGPSAEAKPFGPVALGGLSARLEGPATISRAQPVTLRLELRNTSSEPRVLGPNQTVIRTGSTRAVRQIVLSIAAGPRAGPGLVPDRFQLSIEVPAGENPLYLPPGQSVRLELPLPARRLPAEFSTYQVQAIYFAPPDPKRSGPSHLASNTITLRVGRPPRVRTGAFGRGK